MAGGSAMAGEVGSEMGRVDARAAEVQEEAEAQRIAAILAEIDKLLEGFDDRLAAVNRRLDLVLDRRA